MTNAFDTLNPVEVGARLRRAREEANLTQADAASAADLARTTLVALEQGQRRVRVSELQQLSRLYNTSVNALLRLEAPQVDLIPRFRRHGETNDPSLEQAVKLFSQLVRAEVELENLLGISQKRELPPERPITGGDVQVQAERDAEELRRWLGIGYGPVTDIVSLLELHLGARVFVRRLNGKISGMFAFEESVGPCVLLNAAHPRERRNQTGAHELGHFIGTRNKPDVLNDTTSDRLRSERYANAFGRAFLTPAAAVMQRFREIVAGSEHLTRRHVIVLAHAFGVSREAMVRRLEELGLSKSGTWDWFAQNGGISDSQVRSVIGDAAFQDSYKMDSERPLSLRLSLLAEQAWRQELLSEAQLSRLLAVDRITLRTTLDSLNIGESEANGSHELP